MRFYSQLVTDISSIRDEIKMLPFQLDLFDRKSIEFLGLFLCAEFRVMFPALSLFLCFLKMECN